MFKNILCNKKGYSLIELLIILPFISIILVLIFNILFISNKSFGYTSESFMVAEEIRSFTNTIQKEANQAIKANDNTTIYKPSGTDSELYIYTDLDDDGVPELVRYKLDNKIIYKDIKKTTNSTYPLKYENNFRNRKEVLRNVSNINIFGEIDRVENLRTGVFDDNDHRRKIKMSVEIKSDKDDSPIVIETILVVKSRAQYGD